MLCCILLLLPVLQGATGLFKVRMLHGEYNLPDRPEFGWNEWIEGDFSQKFENYVETRVGFRKFFIRLRNQLRFSLLYKSPRQVLLGKNNYLYERGYVNAWYGRDYSGTDSLVQRVQHLKCVEKELGRRGIHLLVVLAPGKASFFPEYIPFEETRNRAQRPSNYDFYRQALAQLHIPHIDMRKWFLQLKGKTEYPLFTSLGVHWTLYGSLLAGDSLLAYMQQQGQTSMADMSWDNVTLTHEYRGSDADLMELMNLLTPLRDQPFAYPQVKFEQKANTTKPNVLAVADSYYWTLLNDSIPSNCFSPESNYWFYNEKVFNNAGQNTGFVHELNLKAELEKRNFVILLCTDANLYRFPFGFIDNVYKLYCSPAEGEIQP